MKSAVLFLIFNRPDTTNKVFEAIRAARPARLYIAADGPRDIAGEKQKCRQAREVVTRVDWDCEIKTLFSDKNMGCKLAVSRAIGWFFEHENEGVIIEDDILPLPSFFTFCDDMLEKYRNVNNVMSITGSNFIYKTYMPDNEHFFCRNSHIWGWATWKRAWNLYDPDMSRWEDWQQSGCLESYGYGNSAFSDYWSNVFHDTRTGKIDTWDYQWIFTLWSNSGLTVFPSVNLTDNLGYREDATHTNMRPPRFLRKSPPMAIAYKKPSDIEIANNDMADQLIIKQVFGLSFKYHLKKMIKMLYIFNPLIRRVRKYI